jgi:hypothetical protein
MLSVQSIRVFWRDAAWRYSWDYQMKKYLDGSKTNVLEGDERDYSELRVTRMRNQTDFRTK